MALRGWLGVLSFRLAARFLSVRGAGRFGWFFSYGNYREGCSWDGRVGGCGLFADEVRKRPGGLCSLGAFFSVWIVLYMGLPLFYFRLRRAMAWAAMAVETNRAAAAPVCSTLVWTSCGVSAGAGVSVAWMVGCGAVLMLVMTRR